MKQVNYYLPEQQIKALKDQSKKTGISVSEIIRRAIDLWLKQQKKDDTS